MKLRWRKSEMYKRYIQMRGMQRIDAKLYIQKKKDSPPEQRLLYFMYSEYVEFIFLHGKKV